MGSIQMVDLKTQYLHIKNEVDAAILDVLDSTAFINGKPVQLFSEEMSAYLGVKHTIPCANGTDALQIAMMALGLEPGDEVITPSFTYIATTEVVALLRLKPVFVDVNPKTFCMDPVALRNAITPKTKAIVPVHLYGHTAPMKEIMEIANEFGLYVIEDTAQAIGSDYIYPDGTKKKAATIGHIGCTSFFPSKNLGCYGDGGAIFTNDDTLADKMRMIANHGQKVRYYHEMVGCNSRLDTIQAAVLRIKLKHLDQYNAARQRAADIYDELFKGNVHISTPYRADWTSHVFHQYTLTLDGYNDVADVRNGLTQFLAQHQIPSMIYYPVPSHKQNMFASYGSSAFDLPVTDWLTDRVVSLPMHTELKEDTQQLIATKVLEYLSNY
ncbi:MAG: DegT/DnrJ/EryC1/StrS family aminotransferase [Bacteroidota bacterium]|jgi:UDP-2-acetamido-2-deoxy-ribo-hexuluronate aminotransferase